MIDFTKLPEATMARAATVAPSPVLSRLEEMRAGAARNFFRIAVPTALASFALDALLVFFFWNSWDVEVFLFVGFLSVVAVIVAGLFGFRHFADYTAAFKGELIAPLVKKVNASLEFSAKGGIGEDDFKASRLYADGSAVAQYASEDLIAGTIDGIRIEISEAHAQSRHTRSTKNGTETYYKTIFKGLLCVASLPHEADGRVMIRGVKRGFLGRRVVPKAEDREVAGVHPVFDARFAVFSDNEAMARRFATHAGPQLLRLAAAHPKADVRAAHAYGRIFVAVSVERNLLEPPYFTSVERTDLGALLDEIRGFLSLAEVLRSSRTPSAA